MQDQVLLLSAVWHNASGQNNANVRREHFAAILVVSVGVAVMLVDAHNDIAQRGGTEELLEQGGAAGR